MEANSRAIRPISSVIDFQFIGNKMKKKCKFARRYFTFLPDRQRPLPGHLQKKRMPFLWHPLCFFLFRRQFRDGRRRFAIFRLNRGLVSVHFETLYRNLLYPSSVLCHTATNSRFSPST